MYDAMQIVGSDLKRPASSLAVRSLLLLALWPTVGCEPETGFTDPPPAQVSGQISLPAGSSLNPADLQVAARNATTVSDTGSFKFDDIQEGPSLLVVGDASNRPLLAGFSSGDPAQVLAIDARSTALAMLFMATGGFMQPQAEHAHILELIAAHGAFGTFAQVVEARLAANPLAIADRDAELFAALDVALAAMAQPAAQPKTIIAQKAADAEQIVLQQNLEEEQPLVSQLLAQPLAEQSGILAASSDDLSGFQLTNLRRRHLLYYIKQTGYIDENDVRHDADLTVAQGSFPADWLPSTNKLVGAIGSVTDVLLGSGAYQPMNSAAIPLPVLPQSAKQAIYQVTVVGPGVDPGRDPVLGREPYHSGAVEMFAFSFFKDIFLPFMFAGLDRKLDIDHIADPTPLFQGARGLVTLVGSGGHVALSVTSGEPKELMAAIFKTIVDEPAFRQLFINWFTDFVTSVAPELAEDIGVQALRGLATKVNFYLAIIDKAISFGDAAVAAHDMANSNWFEEWEVKAIPPEFKLQPGDVTVINQEHVLMQVQTQVQGNFVYHWKTDGKYGHLLDTKGHSGAEFDSTDAAVNYVGDDPPETGEDTDTVTVWGYLIPTEGPTNRRVLVGKASMTITRKKQEFFGQVTVNIVSAVDGEPIPGQKTSWAYLVPTGERKYNMTKATKKPSSLGQFINARFVTDGVVNSWFQWHGHVPSISEGVSVSARPPGFIGSLDLSVPYELNGVRWQLRFVAYEGNITITGVASNLITFEATARMEWDPQSGFSHSPPGLYGYIDVTVSGHTTLEDE